MKTNYVPTIKKFLLIILAVISVGSLFIATYSFAAPPLTKYAPGEELEPTCAPGSANCSVTLGWEVDTTNNYVYNTTDQIGIGTATPEKALQVFSGDVLFGEQEAYTSVFPAAEPKFIYDSAKAAIQGGSGFGFWTAANRGNFSFSYGSGNIASGDNSVAFGQLSTASGNESFAHGATTASGVGSASFGDTNNAIGTFSFAAGLSNTVNNDYGAAFGSTNVVSADNAVAFGEFNQTNGGSSVVMGSNNIVNSGSGFATGEGNTVTGIASTAIGRGLTINTDDMTAVGRLNLEVGTGPGVFNFTETAFTVGTGTGVGSEANGITVLKNGNTALGNHTNLVMVRDVHIYDTMRIEPIATAPTSPGLGDLYVDSDTNELCFYDGVSWTGLKAGGACA